MGWCTAGVWRSGVHSAITIPSAPHAAGQTLPGAASHHDTKRRWCEPCYHAEAELERAQADDFTNAIGDPAPTVTRVYGGPNV